MPKYMKLTEEIAADIKARVKTLDLKTVSKLRKAKEQNGTFDVIISTEDLDRSGEIVRQDGWDLANYKNNPIVLWGHDYYSLPIGICTETYKTEFHGVPALGARGVFLSAEINPFAQQIRKLYEFGTQQGQGVGCTTSVGFIPKEFDNENGRIITKAELLEFSFVPIPANQGVGPAEGRALTSDDAKELGLDVPALSLKGITFVEAAKTEEPKEKAAEAGDECSMDDGTPGVLTGDPKDPDAPLVCTPKEDKSAEKAHSSQKALLKSLTDEHERHDGELEKAFDDFREKAAGAIEDQGDPVDANKAKKGEGKEFQIREHLKDLRDTIHDENDMHRAKAVACFREFDPSDSKAFEKKEHLKALRGEHDAYEEKCGKSIDDFEERCMKSVQGGPDTVDEHTDWITGLMDVHSRAHKKSVSKIAKAMCRDAFGEEDQADEKTVEILKEYLTPHIDAQMLPAVASKIGSRITAAYRERLREAHEHLKAASAVVEALHGMLGNDDGEESRSVEGTTSSVTAPKKQRSRPTEKVLADDELNAHLIVRDILRGVTTAAQEGLKTLKRAKQ